MSTEVQFYLFFPLAYAALARFGVARFLSAALVFVVAARLSFCSLPDAAQVVGGITQSAFLMNSLAGRFLEFALGMAVAFALLAWPATLASLSRRLLVPCVLAGAWARALGPTWLADPLLGLAFAAVLAWAVTGPQAAGEGLAARFGRTSYSFFLLHFPVLTCLVAAWPGLLTIDPYAAFAILAPLGFLATLPASLGLHHGVELPAWQALRRPRAAAIP
jgi:peptidoglycan/LPS O-acetylase OafA/YrhL